MAEKTCPLRLVMFAKPEHYSYAHCDPKCAWFINNECAIYMLALYFGTKRPAS